MTVSLFWRTFALLSLLVGGGVFAWVQTLNSLELEPRAIREASQIAGLVNLTRAALGQVDGIARITLLKSFGNVGLLHIRPQEPHDASEPAAKDRFNRELAAEIQRQLGPQARLSTSVNGTPGLWLGFSLGPDALWLHLEESQSPHVSRSTMVAWIGIALLATALASAAIAGLINRPLENLQQALRKVREGHLDHRLGEKSATREIRDLNHGFNQMVSRLEQVDHERAIMLAGISHDLRTPLSRLRLEIEMSVSDPEARRNMTQDIEQAQSTLGQFMAYAKPNTTALQPVDLREWVERVLSPYVAQADIHLENRVPCGVVALAEPVGLERVLMNLVENARRYGHSAERGYAEVTIDCVTHGDTLCVDVSDHGPGVPKEALGRLTQPFFRMNLSRTDACGAGLGLSIVERTMRRMGGSVQITNRAAGGLQVHLTLQRAT